MTRISVQELLEQHSQTVEASLATRLELSEQEIRDLVVSCAVVLPSEFTSLVLRGLLGALGSGPGKPLFAGRWLRFFHHLVARVVDESGLQQEAVQAAVHTILDHLEHESRQQPAESPGESLSAAA